MTEAAQRKLKKSENVFATIENNQPIATSKLKHTIFILRTLVSKDFKLKYRRSILGVAWSVLNPLLMMVVLSAVFSFMFKFNIEYFPLYLILGNTLFELMAESTRNATTSIIEAAPLLKKIRVEKMVFPTQKVLFTLVNFVFSLIAVALVVVYFKFFPTANATTELFFTSAYFLFLPLLLIFVLMFCMGLSLLLSSLAVYFRDIIHLWTVVLTAWTYATPLFYPIDLLAPWMQTLMKFNPMYHFVTYFRNIVMWNTCPSLKLNLVCFVFGTVTLLFGILVFRKLQSKFLLYV
ncbi:MAG: ABC transporter permease [Eggerthellaceae bacterium]|nr:ABC transporter permease [Eggerthellaceae bacterium]